jgi:hypothetical protein
MSNLAEAMLTTSGRQERAKEKERAKAEESIIITKAKNQTKAEAADLAASYIWTKMISRQTNAHAQTTTRVICGGVDVDRDR